MMQSNGFRDPLSALTWGGVVVVIAVLMTGPALFSSRSWGLGGEVGTPHALYDGWAVSAPTDVGLDEAQLEKITSDIRGGKFEGIHSYLIVKNGMLVHEAYFDGWGPDDLQTIFSITKSVTSTIIGIAIGRGEITGVDATLPDLLPEYADDMADDVVRTVTLENLLTLTSGFDWDEKSYSYIDSRNSEYAMVRSPNWIRHFLDLPVRDEPGSTYVYNTGSVHLLSAVIRSQTGEFADTYADKHLFEPLGVARFEWNKDPQGHPCTGGTHGGLRLRARDLAKFAYLFLNEGRWQHRQVVPRHWVETATAGKFDAHQPVRIGYLWWTGTYELKGRQIEYFYGAGYGGQSITLFPDLDLLIVFTAWGRSKDADIFWPMIMTVNAALE